MENPYQPPLSANEPALRSSLRLYSPGQIAWATFLGTALGGFVLVAINYFRIRKQIAGFWSLFAAFAATVAVMTLAFFLPDNFPSMIVPLASTAAIYQIAKILKGDEFIDHLSRGGGKGSVWIATGIGLLSGVLAFLVFFAILLILPESWFEE